MKLPSVGLFCAVFIVALMMGENVGMMRQLLHPIVCKRQTLKCSCWEAIWKHPFSVLAPWSGMYSLLIGIGGYSIQNLSVLTGSLAKNFGFPCKHSSISAQLTVVLRHIVWAESLQTKPERLSLRFTTVVVPQTSKICCAEFDISLKLLWTCS